MGHPAWIHRDQVPRQAIRWVFFEMVVGFWVWKIFLVRRIGISSEWIFGIFWDFFVRGLVTSMLLS